MVTIDEVPSLRVVDLKAELKDRGLPISGLKAALVDRLVEALKASETEQTEEPAAGEEPAEPAAGQADEEPAAEQAAEVPVAEQGVEEPAAQAAAPLADTEPVAPTDKPQEPAAEPTDADAAAEPAASTPVEDAAQEDAPATAAPAGPDAAEEDGMGTAATTEQNAAEDEQPGLAGDVSQPGELPDGDRQPESAGVADVEMEPPASVTAEEPASAELAAPDAAAPDKELPPDEADAKLAPSAAEVTAPPAVEPAAAPAPGTADGAEPLVEDEAPEMDFDVEPEEEPTAPPSTSKPAKEAEDATKPSRGKRVREPIPGVKAPPTVTTGGRHSADTAHPAKMQRVEGGTPGSAPTRRLSTQSDVPLLTPRQRSSVKAPPPNMDPTPALRIDNFMRPCTLPQVKQLLSQDGAVIKENCFWMNSIKTHCYVIFESAEQAEVIRQATFNVQFPRDSQKRLAPKFVTVEEAEGVILGTTTGTPRIATAPAAAATPASTHTSTESPGHPDARRTILERRQQRRQTVKPPPPEELGLDDLFRKTETAPHLYWLPVAPIDKESAGSNPLPTANGKV